MQHSATKARAKGALAGFVAASLAASLMIPSLAFAEPTSAEKQAEAQSALASLNAMQDKLEQTAIAYDEAVARAAKRTVTASIAGSVVAVNIEPGKALGAAAGAATSPVQIADLSQMTVSINVNEIDILKITADQTAEVTFTAAPDLTLPATVVSIATTSAGSGDASGGALYGGSMGGAVTYAVKLLIAEPDPRLKPGMTAKATITTTTIDNITEDSFVIRVEFGADTRTLVYGYGSADDLEAFENGTLSTITKVTNPTANTIIVRGMERGQEYTVFVQAVAGDKKGNVSTVSGKTLKLELELVLLEDELTSTSAVVEIRPGGDTSKYRYMLGSMELLDYFENGTWPDIMWENDVTAPKETQATGLTPGETYTIFAQPFAENGTRGETQIIEFTTPTADEAE